MLFPKFSSILAFNLNKIIKRAQELDQENCIFDLWLRLAAYCISPDIVGGCTENDVKLQEINKLIIRSYPCIMHVLSLTLVNLDVFPQNSAIESQSLVRKFNVSGLIDLMELKKKSSLLIS